MARFWFFNFLTVFWIFSTFLENYPPKPEIVGSMEIMVSDFIYRFLKLFDFLENYLAKPGFLGFIEITGWANLFCIRGYALPNLI